MIFKFVRRLLIYIINIWSCIKVQYKKIKLAIFFKQLKFGKHLDEFFVKYDFYRLFFYITDEFYNRTYYLSKYIDKYFTKYGIYFFCFRFDAFRVRTYFMFKRFFDKIKKNIKTYFDL